MIEKIIGLLSTGVLGASYDITNCDELQEMQSDLAGNYYILNDIDCSETASWNDGEGFNPVGNRPTIMIDPAEAFRGSLDGMGHTVSNLTINRPDEDNVGLFGYSARSGTLGSKRVKNLRLQNVNVTGDQMVGGIAGETYLYVVENTAVDGMVLGASSFVGGLIGKSIDGALLSTSFNGDVEGGNNVGGLVGRSSASIVHSTTSGNVTGNTYVGGLIGYANLEGNICYTHSDANINARANAGGLIGQFISGNISDSYSEGSVTADYAFGGFTSTIWGGAIMNTYSTSNVACRPSWGPGGNWCGGFLGQYIGGDIISSYWNAEISGPSWSASGTPMTTEEIQTASSFTGWDFENIWTIAGAGVYPTLTAEGLSCVNLPAVGPDFTYFRDSDHEERYKYDEGGYLHNAMYSDRIGGISLGASSAGYYTSKIFSAGYNARWKSITPSTEMPYGENLPDNGGADSGADMAGNILLMHFDNSATDGENPERFHDASGNGNSGTWSGAVRPEMITTDKRLGAGSVNFPGNIDSFVSIDGTFTPPLQGTVSFWIKPQSGDDYMRPFGLSDSFESRLVAKDGGYIVNNHLSAGGLDTLKGNRVLNYDEWHFVTLTYDTVTGRMETYIDGELDASGMNAVNVGEPGQLLVGFSSAWIGHPEKGDEQFRGNMDELAVWERVLSPEEVLAQYKRGVLRLRTFVRSCDDNGCNGESFAELSRANAANLSITDGRFFQYKYRLESTDPRFSPLLSNVTIEFDRPSAPKPFANPDTNSILLFTSAKTKKRTAGRGVFKSSKRSVHHTPSKQVKKATHDMSLRPRAKRGGKQSPE